MIPNSMMEGAVRYRRNDRASRELRAYAKHEWNADPAWIHSLVPRETLTDRARRWIRRRGAGRPQGVREPTPATPAATPAALAADETCPHPVAEDLGFGGPALFLRCALCGGVLIVHEGRRWSVGRAEPLRYEPTP